MLHRITHKDGDASRAHHEHRQEHKQGRVVGDFALQGALGGYAPHVVETVLHTAHERNERPQQENDTDADEDALRSMRQVVIDIFQRVFQRMALSGEILEKLALQQVLEAEATGNGKQQRQCRHDGQHGPVSEGTGLGLQVAVHERAHAQVNDLQGLNRPQVARVIPHATDAVAQVTVDALPQAFVPILHRKGRSQVVQLFSDLIKDAVDSTHAIDSKVLALLLVIGLQR